VKFCSVVLAALLFLGAPEIDLPAFSALSAEEVKNESLRAMDSANVAPGIYTVTPKVDLVDREHAFCQTVAGGMTARKMFC
jgi:hypothetical protein